MITEKYPGNGKDNGKDPSRNYRNYAKKLILLTALIMVAALSGCSAAPAATVQYKNDVITVEDYYVSTINPYVESTTTLEFLLQNNGERPVPRIEVNFFNIPGFTVASLRCQGTQPVEGRNACIFDSNNAYGELEPFDVRKVSLTLQAPSRAVIKTPTAFTIGYSINYSYSGFRKADIPVIDGVTVTRAVSKFSQSTPTYGPIEMSFEPPVGSTRIMEGQKIEEYWGVQGRPFEVKMNFQHVGSSGTASSSGTVSSVAIESSHVMLDLKGSLAKVEGMACNFEADAVGNLYSKKRVKVPDTLVCNFQTTDPNLPPETITTIWAQFDYTYKSTRSETFEVRPFQE